MKTNDNAFLHTYISTPYRTLHQGKFQLPCTRLTILTSHRLSSFVMTYICYEDLWFSSGLTLQSAGSPCTKQTCMH